MSKRKKRTNAEIKKRRAKFQVKCNTRNNQIKSHIEQQHRIKVLQEDLIRRSSIVEKIYRSKKEDFAIVKDNVLQLNEEKVEYVENICVWKEDNNPVLSGIESLENFPKYTKDFINDVLKFIYDKETKNAITDVDIEDFELVVNEEE